MALKAAAMMRSSGSAMRAAAASALQARSRMEVEAPSVQSTTQVKTLGTVRSLKLAKLSKKVLEEKLEEKRAKCELRRSRIETNKKKMEEEKKKEDAKNRLKEMKKSGKVAVKKSSKVGKLEAAPKEGIVPSIQVTGTDGAYRSRPQAPSHLPVPRIYWRAEIAKREEARRVQQLGEIEAAQKEEIVPTVEAPAVPVAADSALTSTGAKESGLDLLRKEEAQWVQAVIEWIQARIEKQRKKEEKERKKEEAKKMEQASRLKEMEVWNKIEAAFDEHLRKQIEACRVRDFVRAEIEKKRKKEEEWMKKAEERRAETKGVGWQRSRSTELLLELSDLLRKIEEGKRVYVSLLPEIKKKEKEMDEEGKKEDERRKEREEERNKERSERRKEREEEWKKDEAAEERKEWEEDWEWQKEESARRDDFWKKEERENKRIREAIKQLGKNREAMKEIWEEIKNVRKQIGDYEPASPTRVFDFESSSGSCSPSSSTATFQSHDHYDLGF